MKNLELMGVQEMNAVEMKNDNGGSIVVAILIGLYALAWGAVGYSIGKGIAEA